ncbi:MAG: hypothetical protein KDG52_02530 [Rhodocyclaceae bacterium]|nr:hypothetical protein [Rhodocyclaceae bacterium]
MTAAPRTPAFSAGHNIAIKVPEHEYERTVAFYRDILGFEGVGEPLPDAARFRFGDKVLWVDRVTGISQAEIWLEVVTADLALASTHLADGDCTMRPGVEALPEGLAAFWLSSPANIIHLVVEEEG